MKLIIFILAFSMYAVNVSKTKDCSDTNSSGDEASSYCKKAYDSDSWTDSKDYLKKAMNSFNDAMTYSEECHCEEAHLAADDGYGYAKKGYNSTDWEETKDYAKKAKKSADDVMSTADDCGD